MTRRGAERFRTALAAQRAAQDDDEWNDDDGDGEWGGGGDHGPSDDRGVTREAPTASGDEAKRVKWAGAGAWTAAEIMHVTGLPGHDIMIGTLVFAAVPMLFAGGRHPVGSRRLAVGGLVTGTWVTFAVSNPHGVFGGPFGWPTLTAIWALTTLAAWWWIHHLPSLRAAREWNAAKTEWQHKASSWEMHGALLLDRWDTRVGRAYLLDVTGTRNKATYYESRAGHFAEVIAQAEGLRIEQVQIRRPRGARAGRIIVSIRTKNPWKRPIPHPAMDADHEIELPGLNQATCHDPFPVGQDPETGRPLTLPVWTEEGARVAYLLGTRGAGKSTLLNNLYERGTACRDVITIGINLDKASELRDWAPACHLTAIGPDDWTRAIRILRLIRKIRLWRSQHRDTRGGNRNFRPSAKAPLVLVIIDEIDAAARFPGLAKLLAEAYSKDRSEGVAWVTAGQRATADWMGGADLRTLVDTFCIGKVQRETEVAMLLGQSTTGLPDMSQYGGSARGVWGFIRDQGAYPDLGRTWNLTETEDIDDLVSQRAFRQPSLEKDLVEFLGEDYQQLLGEDAFARYARGLWNRGDTTPTPPSANADTVPEGTEDAPSPGRAAVGLLDHPTQPLTGVDFTQLEHELSEQVPGLDEMVADLGARSRKVRDMINQIPEDPDADGLDVTPAQMDQARAELRHQAAASVNIPQDHYRTTVFLLVNGGISARGLAEKLPGVGKTTTTAYLHKIADAGQAKITGGGAARKWIWTGPVPDGYPWGIGDSQ